MKFWAAAVEPGQRVQVDLEEKYMLHLSQVSLGEIKKEKSNESIKVFKHSGDEKLVLATLIPDKIPQQQLDLMFHEEFEISHNWKNGTVFFYGYIATSPFEEEESDEFDSEDSSDEDIPLTHPVTGKPVTKAKEEKHAEPKKTKAASESGAGKQVKIVEPSPVKTDDDDSDSGDEDDSTDEDEDDSDSEGQDGSDDSEEEETPKKPESGKKRAAEVALKTPQEKKAKLITPQKTENKKSSGSVHVATPYPTKQIGKTGKTPATAKNPQTPKSAGSHSCKSCNKTFNSEGAIASHNKAKHSDGK